MVHRRNYLLSQTDTVTPPHHVPPPPSSFPQLTQKTRKLAFLDNWRMPWSLYLVGTKGIFIGWDYSKDCPSAELEKSIYWRLITQIWCPSFVFLYEKDWKNLFFFSRIHHSKKRYVQLLVTTIWRYCLYVPLYIRCNPTNVWDTVNAPMASLPHKNRAKKGVKWARIWWGLGAP